MCLAQHEMDPDTFDPDDLIDAASLLQFGFTLTTLSDWSLEVLEAWLINIKETNTVDGFDTKQVGPSSSRYAHATCLSVVRVVRVAREGRGGATLR